MLERTFDVDGRVFHGLKLSIKSVEVVDTNSQPVLTKILEVFGVQVVALQSVV